MSGPAAAAARDPLASLRWAVLSGNFAIGCGVMVVAGSLNDIVRDLQVSVALAGQLIAVAAVAMAIGAPLLAVTLARIDRRVLLAGALAWYAIGHALCALAPGLAALSLLRSLTVLAAAVFTPQAAAAIGALAPPQRRAGAITFVFLGWSVASVLGMPLHSYIGETFGWRSAFALVAVLSAVAALWVWRAMPAGVRTPPLNLAAWRALATHPALLVVVAVTALSGSGQFALFSYLAPYYRQALGATAGEVSALFFWFGAFGLLGNLMLTRGIDRYGAGRSATWLIGAMAVSMVAWPLAVTVVATAIVVIPWAIGCFASNSAQQARLGLAAPVWAPALMALNTSAIYAGQALGAATGGALVAAGEATGRTGAAVYALLPWVATAFLVAALLASRWATRQLETPR